MLKLPPKATATLRRLGHPRYPVPIGDVPQAKQSPQLVAWLIAEQCVELGTLEAVGEPEDHDTYWEDWNPLDFTWPRTGLMLAEKAWRPPDSLPLALRITDKGAQLRSAIIRSRKHRLSDLQKRVLMFLHKTGATCDYRRMKVTTMFRTHLNHSPDYTCTGDLKQRGLVENPTGTRGGIWLTSEGIEYVAQHLQDAQR